MIVVLEPGTYVVAVSGGVDSMALLHLLAQQSTSPLVRSSDSLAAAGQSPQQRATIRLSDYRTIRLIVAHVDHGMREDSAEDRRLVEGVAKQYGLPFVYHEARLGKAASEATAREARYEFLHSVARDNGAQAIVTAHHQDDVLETAIINLLRGGRRKGLTALASRSDIQRPLLDVPKVELAAYAKEQGLQWREDPTNQDQTYLRNYVRHRLLPRFDGPARQQLLQIITGLRDTNTALDTVLAEKLQEQPLTGTLDKAWFSNLPHDVAREVMAAWLRTHQIRDFDAKALERLVVAAKVAAPAKQFDVIQGVKLQIAHDYLALQGIER